MRKEGQEFKKTILDINDYLWNEELTSNLKITAEQAGLIIYALDELKNKEAEHCTEFYQDGEEIRLCVKANIEPIDELIGQVIKCGAYEHVPNKENKK